MTRISSTDSRPGQPVGDEDQRASRGHIQEVGRERIGGCRIEVLGRFVEHEHREVGQEGTGHDQPLALPPRHADPVMTYVGGEAQGQIAEPRGQPDPVEDAAQLLVRGVPPADTQVVGHRGVEEVGVLTHQPDHGAQVVAGQLLRRHAGQGDGAGPAPQEADQQRRQGRFARSARPHDGHAAPEWQREGHVRQGG